VETHLVDKNVDTVRESVVRLDRDALIIIIMSRCCWDYIALQYSLYFYFLDIYLCFHSIFLC